MANMRITGVRGGAGIPPEKRQTPLTDECKSSIEHTEVVAKGMVLSHFEGVSLNVTKKPPVADKVHHLLFGP